MHVVCFVPHLKAKCASIIAAAQSLYFIISFKNKTSGKEMEEMSWDHEFIHVELNLFYH